MSKAINWPSPFREEVIAEDTVGVHSAFRLGRLYYDYHYWVANEVILIRVNHKVVRKAVVVGDLKCCPIAELTPEDYAMQKSRLRSLDEIIVYLSATYNQPVTPDTEVTVVYYRNLPIDLDILEVEDDPHMMTSERA